MKKYPYQEAKTTIRSICEAAAKGHFDSRDKFMAVLEENPHIAAQGYNPYGKIFFWNDASADLYGHSESAAINQDLFELILPPDFRKLAHDMVTAAAKTGKMPEAGPCDLVRYNGHFVTVFSGHLVFKWDDTAVPEFYCIDLPTCPDSDS